MKSDNYSFATILPALRISSICLSAFLLIFTMLLTGCTSDDETNDKEEEEETSCTNTALEGYGTIVQGETTREYILYIPSSYNGNAPMPLVINFHGFGGCAADYATNVGTDFDFNSVADNDSFIVVYPQGVIRAKGAPEWDPGDNGIEDINSNDLYFTEQLINKLANEYNIDQTRVYATGYSNGGMMAYGLACSRSDLVAAVGIMSGVMLPDECNESAYTSIIHFHGIADEVLPFQGNQDFQPIPDVIDFWLNHNNISSSNLISTQLNEGNVVKEEYSGGNQNTSVILYTINEEHGKEGGHVWFSDEIEGEHPNQILWDFLSNYTR